MLNFTCMINIFNRLQNRIKVAQAVAYSRSNDAKAALHLDYVCVVMIDQIKYLWHLVWLRLLCTLCMIQVSTSATCMYYV